MTKNWLQLDHLLYLFVLADDFFPGDWIVFQTVVSRVDNQFTERAEAAVTTDGKQRRVEERVIFTKVVLTLRPAVSDTNVDVQRDKLAMDELS